VTLNGRGLLSDANVRISGHSDDTLPGPFELARQANTTVAPGRYVFTPRSGRVVFVKESTQA